MNIGILTFYKVANFGANLQGISTYFYLKNNGYNPIFLNYISHKTETQLSVSYRDNIQTKEHLDFLNNDFVCQTENLYDSSDIIKMINKYNLDAIIIGSDAVVQHHPLLSRIHRGKRKPFYIEHPNPERMFPNLFWGVGYAHSIPTAMMSVSCQNSKYSQFSVFLKNKMRKALADIKYISVRDTWTRDMMMSIDSKLNINITPDPVFAFNYNVGDLVPSEDNIKNRFNLPSKYILVSLHSQSLSVDILKELNTKFRLLGMECVAFPMPTGIKFQHQFSYQINLPLSPIDWYAIIKYSSGYVGSNMHPIIVSLHNAIPCFSVDNWGTKNFFNKAVKDGSSKVQHIMSVFNLNDNIKEISDGVCDVSADQIVSALANYPKKDVKSTADRLHKDYLIMMENIINCLNM